MKILTILGTRPEIIRLSLIIKKLDKLGIKNTIIHTGQNYDSKLSDIFFKDLDLREPDYYLGIKENTVGAQIGKIRKIRGCYFKRKTRSFIGFGGYK